MMTPEHVALASLALAVVGQWVRTATRIALLETRVVSHSEGLGRFEDSINKLTRVVDRLAVIEEMRNGRETNSSQ